MKTTKKQKPIEIKICWMKNEYGEKYYDVETMRDDFEDKLEKLEELREEE